LYKSNTRRNRITATTYPAGICNTMGTIIKIDKAGTMHDKMESKLKIEPLISYRPSSNCNNRLPWELSFNHYSNDEP
jgi:hypothetical protein